MLGVCVCVRVSLLIEWLELNNMGYMRLIIITFLKQAHEGGAAKVPAMEAQTGIERRVMSQQQDYFKNGKKKKT